MRKKLFTITLLASVLFATFSCKKDEVEEPTLTLSDVSVQLPKAASEKAITVTTNQAEWTALANADWIHLTQSGNTLTIKVDENLTTEKRTGEVAVLAVIGKKVLVEQEGSDVSIVVLPDKFSVDQFGGQFVFDINANTQDWTVSVDADWLKLTPKQFKHEIVVNIDENKGREDRVAKLIFQVQNQPTREYLITQDGIIYHMLPYMDFGEKVNPEDIDKFESTRHSELIGKPGYYSSYYTYETVSPAFDQIAYKLSGKDNLYVEAIVYTKETDFFTKENGKERLDFIQYLKENGFAEESENVFFNKEKKVKATININSSYPNVLYEFTPEQPKAYPTFDKFPWGLNDYTANEDKIKEYENANGGTYKTELSDLTGKDYSYLFYDVNKGYTYGRAYFVGKAPRFAEGILLETAQYFTEKSLVFWDYEGTVYLTKEFEELCEKEGFKFVEIDRGSHTFINSKENRKMSVKWAKYSDFEKPVLDMHIWYYKSSSSVNKDGFIINGIKHLGRKPNADSKNINSMMCK